MADIKQIKVGNTNYNISGAAIVLEDNGTTTDGVWLAKTNQISALEDGQLFLYRPIRALSASRTATLNITANGTALGAKSLNVSEYGSGIYGGCSEKLTQEVSPNGQFLLFTYSSSDNYFILMNMVSSNLHNITKIYNHNGSSDYYDGICFTSYGGVDINGDRYFAHIKDNGVYIGGPNNNAYFSGTSMKFNGSKIYIGANCSGMEFHPNRTKIYAYSQYTGESSAQMQLWSRNEDYEHDGLFINRPIYLASSNEDATSATSSMSYNADEDCIEFKFE